MKNYKPFLLVIVMSMLFVSATWAQKNYTEEADDAFKMKMYYEAIDLYKKAYSKVGRNQVEKRRILFRIAESYRLTNNIRRAEFAYVRAIRSKYSDPVIYLRYAQVLKKRQKYEDAITQFKKYKEKVPDDPRADRGIESCKLAKDWQENPTRYEVDADRRINDRESDFAPMYADRKYKTIVFTSTRDEATGKMDPNTGEVFSDFFITTRDKKDNWSRAEIMDEEEIINTDVNEGTAFFDRRFNTIYFTRCPMEKNKVLSCKIYYAKKRGRTWSDPEKLDLGPDTATYGHPTLTRDGRTIIFASDMEGGEGGLDLWKATRRSSTRPFKDPVNLGPVINTSEDEMYPYLRDDKTLYFSSNGHVGLGGQDIFISGKKNNEWGEPENMKVPINSHMDDFGITFNKNSRYLERQGNEEMGFFTTNRRGGRGGDDLWHFWLEEIIFTLSGDVRDNNTLQLIPDATVTMVGSDGTNVETKTDNQGHYNFNKNQVNKNTSYEVEVKKEKYFSKTKKETTVGLKEDKDLVLNFNLEPIPVEPITLPEIRFELAKWNLQKQYQDSLNGLVKLLKNNPKFVIELAAHTDYQDDTEDNDTLSLKRAKSCMDYIVSEGIDEERIIPKGYGERKPRKLKKSQSAQGVTFDKGTYLTEEYIKDLPSRRRQKAANQLNRRVTFKIVRTDYVSSDKKIASVDSTAQDTSGYGGIQLNPEENKVALEVVDNNYQMPMIVNGKEIMATYSKNSDAIYISHDKALEYLKNARITKDNFTKGAEAIKEDGTIVENTEVSFNTVTIANREINDVKMIVTYDQEQEVIIGDKGLKQFGSFEIDRDNDELIFTGTAGQ